MRHVDPAVHDGDAPAAPRHAQTEQPVRADLRRSDLSRGTHEAVEADVDDVLPERERGDLGRGRPACDDGNVREAARDREARVLGSRPEGDDDRNPRFSGPHVLRDLLRHHRGAHGNRCEGERGSHRGEEERIDVHMGDIDRDKKRSKGRAGSDSSR